MKNNNRLRTWDGVRFFISPEIPKIEYCSAERRGFELSVPLPHVEQTVPKRPLWDTFRTEKPKGFWVFSRVQTPFARQSFDLSPKHTVLSASSDT
jgi:hypothetical protein